MGGMKAQCVLVAATGGADVIGPFGALIDPGFDGGDLIVGEAATHGHAGDIADAGDAAVEGAIGGVAGDDDFGEDGLFGVEAEAGHLGVRAVAGNAGAGEDGLDVADEIDFGGGGSGRRLGGLMKSGCGCGERERG